MDIFCDHDGVIDEHADADDEGEDGEDIEGFAGEVHDHEGDEEGEGYGECDDGGEAEAAEEHEEDEGGEGTADDAALDEVHEGVDDGVALVEQDFHEHTAEAGVFLEFLEVGADAAGDIDCIGFAFLEDDHGDGGAAIDADGVAFFGFFVADAGDIAEPHIGCDGAVFEFVEAAERGDRAEHPFAAAIAYEAAGHGEVIAAEVLGELVEVEAVGFGGLAVDLDQHFLFLEAVDADIGDAVDAFYGLDDFALEERVEVGE
ncbi:MAG: hypothetical protein RI897_2491 [Verrucomicrobiota bacterium]